MVGPGTLNVADAAIQSGDPSLALSISQSILNEDPRNGDALVHEGDAYYALGRCPAAAAAYQLALKANARSAPAETGLGRCLLKTDPAAAAAVLAQATRDDPGSAAAWNDLGVADDLTSNFPAALAAYDQALAVDPRMNSVEVNLGLSLALSGNGAAALQYLGPLAYGQDATPKIREDYAAALVAVGRESEARTVLAVDLTPQQVDDALAGYNEVIAAAQPPLNVAAAALAAPPPPTQPTLRGGVVTTSALPPPVPLLPRG